MSGHAFGLFLVGLLWVSVAVAVAVDAAKRGRYGSVWGITVFFLGPVGLGLYVLAVLSGLATRERDSDKPEGGTRVCPECSTVQSGSPAHCSQCGHQLGPDDEPPPATLLRSGSRGYCSNCKTRVSLDADVCPNCDSLF